MPDMQSLDAYWQMWSGQAIIRGINIRCGRSMPDVDSLSQMWRVERRCGVLMPDVLRPGQVWMVHVRCGEPAPDVDGIPQMSSTETRCGGSTRDTGPILLHMIHYQETEQNKELQACGNHQRSVSNGQAFRTYHLPFSHDRVPRLLHQYLPINSLTINSRPFMLGETNPDA